jgi:hypothetical protein
MSSGGTPIIEVAEELGHRPQMTVGTYAHVMHELRGAPPTICGTDDR